MTRGLRLSVGRGRRGRSKEVSFLRLGAQAPFGLGDAFRCEGVDPVGMRGFAKGGRGAEVDAALPEEGLPPVVVSAEDEPHAGIFQQDRFEASGVPVGVGVAPVVLGGDQVVLKVDLGPGVVV